MVSRCGDLLRHAVKLRGRRLIKPDFVFDPKDADGFEQAQRAERVGIRRVFGRFERDPHMALGGEIVDFRRLNFLDNANEIGRIRHVAIMQKEPDAGTVRVLVQMIDARGVE